jgi:hypothetical protein
VRLPIMLRVTVAGTNTLASLSSTGNTATSRRLHGMRHGMVHELSVASLGGHVP